MEKVEKGEQRVMVRELSVLRNNFARLAIIVVSFLIVVVLYQWVKIRSLEGKVKREVYVTVDDRTYNAFPELRTRTEKDYKIFAEVIGYNAFAHDFNSYDEHMDLVKPMMTDAVFNYIQKSFEYKGQSLKDYYKKYDARSYFKIDSMRVEQKGKDAADVLVYGKQSVVFSIGEPVTGPLSFRLSVVELENGRSEANKFGLFVSNFNFISQ